MRKTYYLIIIFTGIFFVTGGYLNLAHCFGGYDVGFAGKLGYFVINGGDLKDTDLDDIFGDYDGNGIMLGAELDFYFNRMMGLAIMVDYYNVEEEFELLGYSSSIKQVMAPITVNLKIRFPTPGIKPYFGGGLGVYFWDAEASFQGDGLDVSVGENGTEIGFNVFGGVQLSPGAFISLFGEIRYHYLGTLDFIDDEALDFASDLNSIETDLSGFQISGGVMLSF